MVFFFSGPSLAASMLQTIALFIKTRAGLREHRVCLHSVSKYAITLSLLSCRSGTCPEDKLLLQFSKVNTDLGNLSVQSCALHESFTQILIDDEKSSYLSDESFYLQYLFITSIFMFWYSVTLINVVQTGLLLKSKQFVSSVGPLFVSVRDLLRETRSSPQHNIS